MASSASNSLPVRSAYFFYGSGLQPSKINTSVFTHLYYAFAYMDSNSYNVIPDPNDTTGYMSTFSDTVRATNPGLKTLLAIGGANAEAEAYSAMAASPEHRAAFIKSSISLAKEYNFDGLDLDWEYPSSHADMSNLALLIQEWSAAAKKQSPPLLLTAATFYSTKIDYHTNSSPYPAATMAKYLDWVTIMAYDLHDGIQNQTVAHTALFHNTANQIRTIDYGVRQWLGDGLPASSALLGLAAFGHTWFLADPAVNGVGAPASGKNAPIVFSDIQGYANGEFELDGTTDTAYCSWNSGQRTIWAGFDNPTTIATKVEYLREKGLRGYAFWKVDGDRNSQLFTQASQTLLA